ncbi:MAG: hypothetical protein Q8L14_30240 [Myxococcales bacterium]|nr:hypothetical protein [Myxococcales bacterium]
MISNNTVSHAARASLVCLVFATAAWAGDDDDKDQDAEDEKMLEQMLGGVTAGAPPEVKAVMKKMQDGDDLTPAEEKILQQWMQKKSGQQPPPLADSVKGRPWDAPAQCTGPSKAKPFSDAEWQTFSTQLKATWVKKLGAAVAELDAAIAKSKRPVDVADLGAVLYYGRAFTQSGYVLLVHLGRMPQDHVALSHLALVLSAQSRGEDSLRVHLRARDKAPKAALVQANAGHALLHEGDCAAARKAFDAAEAIAPLFGPMLSGQAMVAALEGRQEDANRYLTAGRRQQHSPATETVVDEATDSTEPSRPRPNDRQAQPQPAAPRPFWRDVPPIVIPMPPVGVGIDGLVGNLKPGTEWLEFQLGQLTAASQRTKAAVDAVKAQRTAQSRQFRLGPSVSVPMPDSAAVGAFWAAYREYNDGMSARSREMKKALDPTMKDLGARYGQSMQDQARETMARCPPRSPPGCSEAVAFDFCNRRKRLAGFAVANFEGTWPAYATGTKQGLERFWTEAGRPMEAVGEPAVKKMLYEFRRTIVRRDLVALGGVVTAWRGGIAPGVYERCVQPTPVPVQPTVPDPPMNPARTCVPGKAKLKVFVFSAEVSCDQVKAEFAAGVHIAVEDDLKTGETTMYLGAAAGVDVGIAGIGAKGGMYATVDANDNIVDVGFYQTRSVDLFGAELEMGGRIGIAGIKAGASASVMTPGEIAVGKEIAATEFSAPFQPPPTNPFAPPAAQ